MQFYNSLTRKNEDFAPLHKDKVTMYVCGLTPYDHAHLGHARTYAAFDMLKRFFIQNGYNVFHIQNVTDVDDKILRRAKESGEKPLAMAEKFHSEARELFRKLHILDADVYPKVTEHIPEIISLVQKLAKEGYAYETETGVYFEVGKFKGYGKLSGQKMDEILAGSRKEVDETKRSPEDFALWKKTSGEAIEFESPWGCGRPGWHIECSAMAGKYAPALDIHGGARDLIFPHHENEIAQSEAASGKQFVKYWLHTGFLTVNGEKMSKSLGNFVTLRDVLTEHSPNAVRMFFAMAHYRSPIDYNPDQIRQAEATVERIFNFMDNVAEALEKKEKKSVKDKALENEAKNKFRNFHHFLAQDFDVPTAITFMFSMMTSTYSHLEGESYDYAALKLIKDEMEKALYVIGLVQEKKEVGDKTKELIELLIELRDDARKRKDFEASDKIRNRLRQLGVALEDSGGKTKWKIS
ncbi:Cysteine--tRNA ligase [Candidatus Burarchaeum australiense]|nr:Cysteine--tRNA ligase [Candidatus Burarchaeum australiense]